MADRERPTAVVTGASGGIGAACVRALVELGYAVLATGRDRARLRSLADEHETKGPTQVVPLALDLSTPDAADVLVAAAIEEFGRLDLVLANAGTYLERPIEDTSPEEWDAVLRINLSSVHWLVRRALPEIRTRSGWVIVIGSVSGLRGYAGEAAYGSAKRALQIITDVVLEEAGSDGVRATLIAPGVVRTAMAEAASGPAHGEGGDAPGLLSPDDVAATVRYLLSLSPAASVPEIVLRDTRWQHDPKVDPDER